VEGAEHHLDHPIGAVLVVRIEKEESPLADAERRSAPDLEPQAVGADAARNPDDQSAARHEALDQFFDLDQIVRARHPGGRRRLDRGHPDLRDRRRGIGQVGVGHHLVRRGMDGPARQEGPEQEGCDDDALHETS